MTTLEFFNRWLKLVAEKIQQKNPDFNRHLLEFYLREDFKKRTLPLYEPVDKVFCDEVIPQMIDQAFEEFKVIQTDVSDSLEALKLLMLELREPTLLELDREIRAKSESTIPIVDLEVRQGSRRGTALTELVPEDISSDFSNEDTEPGSNSGASRK